MRVLKHLLALLPFVLLTSACLSSDPPAGPSSYTLDAQASGVVEKVNNILNMTVVSTDANDLKAEYRAGFVQGKLQGGTIVSARDNVWDNTYLTDPSHSFPKQLGPSTQELARASQTLNVNYASFLNYLRAPSTDADVAHKLKRLLFRMLGIYHGVVLSQPQTLDFSGTWLPDASYLSTQERTLNYETSPLSFMDVYLLNADNDMMDVLSYSLEAPTPAGQPEKCSAFLKRTPGDVLLAHNTWQGFLSQSMVQTLSVNGDRITMNASTPGLIASGTDFGYNNKGILFNETTHRLARTQVKETGLWIFWRAALAENFSASIPDFFKYISLDNTGTYLNGYMLVDAKTQETGLVEMSYRCFVYYRSNGGAYSVTSASMDGNPCSTEYDAEMVTPTYLMGINYPASLQVRSDLGSQDNRPARKRQFAQFLPNISNIEGAKSVLTYTDPANPLSIFGRWDLGYGETAFPKTIPDGSIDAKVASASMVRSFMGLSGTLNPAAQTTGFWMLYGTPYVNGAPFVWSQSAWKNVKRRDVPDRLDGTYTQMNLYLQ